MRLAVFALLLIGCAPTTVRDETVRALNIAAVAESAAGAELTERCTAGYRRASTHAAIQSLDAACIPARKAYGILRQARLAALAAVLAAQASGDEMALVTAIPKLAAATLALERAIATLPEAP